MVMSGDPYVGDLINLGVPARLREGAFQRLQAEFPWAKNPRDVAEYMRDVAEMRPWTMGGMYLSDPSGLDWPWNWNVEGSVPQFFIHNPEAIVESIPLKWLRFLGIPIVVARNAPLPVRAKLFEALQGYMQHTQNAIALREMLNLVRKYTRKKAPDNPYEGISGYRYIGRGSWTWIGPFKFGYKDMAPYDSQGPIQVTLLEIAQAMSRVQTNKLMPSNWRNSLANAIARLTPEEEGSITEMIHDMFSMGKDVDHIFGPGDYSEVDDMPYNRRTGQWYPSRRNYGFQRRRRYSGGGYSPRRRNTYRRSYRRW